MIRRIFYDLAEKKNYDVETDDFWKWKSLVSKEIQTSSLKCWQNFASLHMQINFQLTVKSKNKICRHV